MPVPDDDLLALFLAEAEERLAALAPLTARAAEDEEAAAEVRRQLHALKGAARMLGLAQVAETCHEAEEAAGRSGGEVDGERLVRLVDRIAGAVRALAGEAKAEDRAPAPGPAASAGSGGTVTSDHAFVPAATLDRLTDEATTLRIAALGVGHLVRELGELAALAKRGTGDGDAEQVAALLTAGIRRLAVRADGTARRLERLAGSHRRALLELQMQPVEPFLHALARHARELAERLGKRVQVIVRGGDVRLDRRIVAALESSLLHLVRNAVDHGIEPPDERRRAGKPECGTVTLEASAAGGRVRVVVADDGRGLDRERIEAVARERGLLAPGGPVPPLEELVLRPGFSTREAATEISGRGVGLDAVAAAVERIGGDLSLASSQGRGLEVVLDLPSVRRGVRVIVAAAGPALLGVPTEHVVASRPAAELAVERTADGTALAALDGRSCPVVTLAAGENADGVALELRSAGRRVVLLVDAVLGREEVVVRPLPARAARGTLFDGMAVLSSGRALPVLASEGLEAHPRLEAPGRGGRAREARPPHVLLVDDSPVTRAMERRLLEDAGFEVTAVADGDAALALLAREPFDCLVTDIEMPGLDGLELTRRVRESPRLGDLPVVVVSTRDRPADRLAGLQAGADAYIAKQELRADALTETIRRLAGGRERGR